MFGVEFSTEGIVIISTLLASLAGAITYVFKLLMQVQKEKFELAIKLLEEQKKSYREIAEEAVNAAEVRIGPRLPRVAAVVPEHNSPTTPQQQETADIVTLRARVTAITLAEGLPPRTTTPSAEPVSPEVVPDLVTRIEEVKAAVVAVPDKVFKKIKDNEPPN